MKILLGSSLYAPNSIGGAERVVEALAQKLVARGHEVVVITTQPRGPRAHIKLNNVSVHYLPVANLYRPFGDYRPGPVRKALWRVLDSYNWRMRSPVGDILEKERPDVVNTHSIVGFSVSLWSAAFERGIPLVHTLHDQYLLCHRSTMFKGGRNCVSRCIDCQVLTKPRKRASNLVDVAIGVSKFISQRHVDYGFFSNAFSTVIYNTALESEPPSAMPRTLSTRFRFGFLGQIVPTKGLHCLIEAFQRLVHTDAELIIAGKGDPEYETVLREKTATDPRFKWLGYVNPATLFCEIDILIVPSVWNDTAPLVVMEAFRHGVPVLGSNQGGIPELITPGTGWVFSYQGRNALDRAIVECLISGETYEAMSANCLEHARQSFLSGWEEHYISAYEIARKRRRDIPALS